MPLVPPGSVTAGFAINAFSLAGLPGGVGFAGVGVWAVSGADSGAVVGVWAVPDVVPGAGFGEGAGRCADPAWVLPATDGLLGGTAEAAGGWPDLFDPLLAAGGVLEPATRKAIVMRLARPASTLTCCAAECPLYDALTRYFPGGTLTE